MDPSQHTVYSVYGLMQKDDNIGWFVEEIGKGLSILIKHGRAPAVCTLRVYILQKLNNL